MQEKGLKLIARPKEWTEHIFCSAMMLPQVAGSYLLLCMGTQCWYICCLYLWHKWKLGEGVSCYTIAEFVLYFIDVMHICAEREGILISS